MAGPQQPNNQLWDNSAMHIYQWAQNRQANIRRAFAMKGGWEAWLQVELGLNLANEQYTTNVQREQLVYNGAQRADIVIDSRLPIGGAHFVMHRTIIELKCESQYQDCILNNNVPQLLNGLPQAALVPAAGFPNGIPSIANRLKRDVDKRQHVPGGNGTQFAVIGFSNTPEARSWAVQQYNQNPNNSFQPMLVDNQNLLMWYWSVYVP